MSNHAQINSVQFYDNLGQLVVHFSIGLKHYRNVPCYASIDIDYDNNSLNLNCLCKYTYYFTPTNRYWSGNDLKVTINYSRLGLSSTFNPHRLKVAVSIYNSENGVYITSSNYYYFSFNAPYVPTLPTPSYSPSTPSYSSSTSNSSSPIQKNSNSGGLLIGVLSAIGIIILIALGMGVPVQIIIAIPVVGIGTIMFMINLGNS